MLCNPLATNLSHSPVQAWEPLMHTSMPGWTTCTQSCAHSLPHFQRMKVRPWWHFCLTLSWLHWFSALAFVSIPRQKQQCCAICSLCAPNQGELSCSRALVCWTSADSVDSTLSALLSVCVLHNNNGRWKFCSISSSIVQVIKVTVA